MADARPHERERLVAPMADANANPAEESDNERADTTSKVSDSAEVPHAGWTPFYLQTTTLLGFAVVYLVLLLAIVILAIADAKYDGIATAQSSEHYLWTYGPTAVLAILAALWGQVEYRTKQAMPWKVLQQKPTPASKTLLLDYITPSLPEGLINSLRAAHWPVAIAITNSLLIKLLTVASTGLLVLLKTPTSIQSCQLTAAADFVTSFNTSAIGSAPVLSTLAIQNGSIPYPPGTSRDLAFRQLEAPTHLRNSQDLELEGLVNSFYAGLDCETATVTSHGAGCSDIHCRGFNVSITIDSPTCQIPEYNYTKSCNFPSPNLTECDLGDAWGMRCDTTTPGHDANRLIFVNGRMNEQMSEDGSDLWINVLTNETTMIVCEPTYNITAMRVRMDSAGNFKNVVPDSVLQNASQPFPAWDLVEGLYTSVKASSVILGERYGSTAWSSNPWSAFPKFFDSWVKVAYAERDLRDPDTLKAAASDIFSMAMAQMARQNLMSPAAGDVVGTCYDTEWRLRIRGLSLYLMAATLVLSAVSTLFLVYTAPRRFTTRDPATIGGLALILSRSPTLLDGLSHQGALDIKAMEKRLQGYQCQSVFSGNGEKGEFRVELTSEKMEPDAEAVPDATETPSEATFWRPLALSPFFKLFVIAFLLLLIVGLEVVYSLSEKWDGLVEVDPTDYVRFSWVYLPAMIMLTSQMLVGMITFSSLLIFPYFILRSRTSNTRDDILRDYTSQTAIVSAWKSAANKHFAAFFITLAMLLSPLLTIAVSGLYTAQPVETTTAITLSFLNQFNSTNSTVDLGDYSTVPHAATTIGLLLTQNYTFPPQTFNDLVFPEITFNLPAPAPSGNITTTLPALRAELSCNSGASAPANFSNTRLYHNATLPGPFVQAGCTASVGVPPGPNPFGFFEKANSDSPFGTAFCGAYGTSEIAWRAFICVTVVQQLSVAVTLDAATLSILSATPDESSAQVFANRTLATDLGSGYPAALIPSLFGQADFGGATPAFALFDPVFQAAMYAAGTTTSPYDFPVADYMGDTDETQDAAFAKLETHLRSVYRTVVAQAANLMIRVPRNASAAFAPPETVAGTLTGEGRFRLKQSGVATRILDGLLAAVAVCIAVAAWAMGGRDVVPVCPGTVGAGAALISGDAEMVRGENVGEGAQWCGDREVKERGLWEGGVFSLGWWEGRGGLRFGLDMGRAERGD